jgi:hypothetical protein
MTALRILEQIVAMPVVKVIVLALDEVCPACPTFAWKTVLSRLRRQRVRVFGISSLKLPMRDNWSDVVRVFKDPKMDIQTTQFLQRVGCTGDEIIFIDGEYLSKSGSLRTELSAMQNARELDCRLTGLHRRRKSFERRLVAAWARQKRSGRPLNEERFFRNQRRIFETDAEISLTGKMRTLQLLRLEAGGHWKFLKLTTREWRLAGERTQPPNSANTDKGGRSNVLKEPK